MNEESSGTGDVICSVEVPTGGGCWSIGTFLGHAGGLEVLVGGGLFVETSRGVVGGAGVVVADRTFFRDHGLYGGLKV